MVERLKGITAIIKLILVVTVLIGVYLVIAWASYSPLDNAWSVASSVSNTAINRAGSAGAWYIDVLFSMFGSVAFFIPFALMLVPLYLLLAKMSDSLNFRSVFWWLCSFGLFMLGLSSLASVLFSDSVYYLSGGFIGAMFGSFISNFLGQIGVLLFALFFIAVGFYFCSGQVLVGLFTRLYQWITEEKEETTPSKAHQPSPESSPSTQVQLEEQIQAVEVEPEADELEPASPLTDVSQFVRPKITGLKPQNASSVPVNIEKDVVTNVQSFQVNHQPTLPQVTLESSSAEIEQVVSDVHPMSGMQQETALPTVSLIPTPTISAGDNTAFSDNQIEKVIPSVSSSLENQAVVQDKEPVIDIVLPTEASETVALSKAKQPEVHNAPYQSAQAEAEVQSNKPNYPQSYGNSLIHPLLQKQKTLEKPTTPLPTLALLEETTEHVQQTTEQEIRETSQRIEQELANFGVKATVEDVLVGPVVTRYEIQPAAGVKASKITNLDSDLARALIFKAIRITEVVPGKPFMGIETPNRYRETVWLRDVLASDAFIHSKATLPMALGKDISGKSVVVDMAKMPHLLVAGQTGGGKSVGVNTMILSLLFKLTPEQLRFIMIDPKVVELSIYNDIPHLLTPVITDAKKAENALRWAVEEMERRYLLVSSLSVRNIEGYNAKIQQAEEMGLPIPNPLWRPGDTMDSLPPPLEKLSYIVLIVDEFADLMMSAGKQVEDYIMRIAQKARAVGIHLILATQRPSADVITGVIKANIPSRIAFTVASQIDSRTILDKGGAESLLGRGDMLYSGAGSPEIIRVHGAFMSDDDVQRVADNWRARGKPTYINSIVESANEEADGTDKASGGEVDPLFDEITQYVIDSGVTSISGIQRRFSLGFNRAARIIDQLEEQGVVSSPDNRGKREVLAR